MKKQVRPNVVQKKTENQMLVFSVLLTHLGESKTWKKKIQSFGHHQPADEMLYSTSKIEVM